MDQDQDWSTRHVRMRVELVVTSVVIFLVSRFDVALNEQGLLPIKFAVRPGTHHVLIGLVAFFTYTFIHLLVRTADEWGDVARFRKAVSDTLAKIDTENARVEATVSKFGGDELLNRLSSWDQAIERMWSDPEVGGKDHNLDGVVDRLVTEYKMLKDEVREAASSRSIGNSEDPEIGARDAATFRSDRHNAMVFPVIENLNRRILAYNESASRLEEMKDLSQKSLRDFQVFINETMPAVVRDHHGVLLEALKEMQKIRRAFIGFRRWRSIERFFLSFCLPVIIATAFVFFSVPAICEAWNITYSEFVLWIGGGEPTY